MTKTLFAGLLLSLATMLSVSAEANPLWIHWIDVEGGAATLVVTPAGESILFDTGMPGLRDPVRINRHCRKAAGLKKIDHLVITHFDKDHYGGAADLSKLIPIGIVYDHGVRPQDVARVGEEYLNFDCDRRLVLRPGDQIPLKQAEGTPELRIDILASLQRFIEPTDAHAENARPADAVDQDPDLSHNANSIVALLHFGDFDFLDAADLTWNLEERLVVPFNLVGEVDVYQTNHHGLDRSNNPTLIRSIKPKVAIMNNGHTKGCGPMTFATLKSTPSIEAIYQVHKNLRDDGSENNTTAKRIANTTPKENCTAHPILMEVAADGKSYVVVIPATGLREEYQVK